MSSDIHKGLKERGLRDLIANQERDTFVGTGLYARTDTDRRRQMLQDAIARAQKELEAFELGVALRTIMDLKNWELFDHSDVTPYDAETYISFVGTPDDVEKVFGEDAENVL